jgi:AbrB family looped-hinge helix DNA binding protein
MTKPSTFLHGRTTVGERGQIVIPQNIRTAMKVKAGDEMVVMSRGDRIIVLPAKNLEEFYQTVIGQMDDLRKQTKK